MTEPKLKSSLEALRAEVERLETSRHPNKPRLDALLADIEKASPTGANPPGLVPKVREAILHFEADHPKITAILNDVLLSLDNVGM